MHLGQYSFTMASPGMSDRPAGGRGQEQSGQCNDIIIDYLAPYSADGQGFSVGFR